ATAVRILFTGCGSLETLLVAGWSDDPGLQRNMTGQPEAGLRIDCEFALSFGDVHLGAGLIACRPSWGRTARSACCLRTTTATSSRCSASPSRFTVPSRSSEPRSTEGWRWTLR